MLNPREYLLDLKELSVRVNEYLEGEHYRYTYPNDVIFNDQDLLNLCIPLIVSDLRDLGINIDLSESDYLYEWEKSEAIIALRKYVDKDYLSNVLSINSDRIVEIESLFEFLNSDVSGVLEEFLIYARQHKLGDINLLDRISYLDNDYHSTELFKSHVLAVCLDVTKKGILVTESDTIAYSTYTKILSAYINKFNKVLTYIVTNKSSPLLSVVNTSLDSSDISTILLTNQDYYTNESFITKVLWLFKNPDRSIDNIVGQLSKTSADINNTYPYSCDYVLTNKVQNVDIVTIFGVIATSITRLWILTLLLAKISNTNLYMELMLFAPYTRKDNASVLECVSKEVTALKALMEHKSLKKEFKYYLNIALQFSLRKFNLTMENSNETK